MIDVRIFCLLIMGSGFLPVDGLKSTFPQSSPIEFTVLITSYKNEKWAEDNIKSACSQKSTNPYRVIVINDCSPDSTGAIIDEYVQKNNRSPVVKVIHNNQRVGGMANIYHAIHLLIPDHHVVVSLDGDDLFAHDEVLLELEKHYQDPHIWMTWGSVQRFPSGGTEMSRNIPDSIFREHKLREYTFVSQHLRTFKAGLFKKIKKEDMMYNGAFMEVAWDLAFMFPMLEMASAKDPQSRHHHAFIKEVLYLYRINNPISDFRIHKEAQTKMCDYIRKMTPYQPIDRI